jgi:hypothetical protein
MRLDGHVDCIGQMINAYYILVGQPEGDPSVDGKMILKWILKKCILRVWTQLR